MVSLLGKHSFGVLATCGDGHPHTSLITVVMDPDGEKLLFPTLTKTTKYSNLSNNGNVSVLFDNRATERDPEKLYALSVFGSARDVGEEDRAKGAKLLLLRHPHLSGFLAQPGVALVKITIGKLVLVEGFGKVSEITAGEE